MKATLLAWHAPTMTHYLQHQLQAEYARLTLSYQKRQTAQGHLKPVRSYLSMCESDLATRHITRSWRRRPSHSVVPACIAVHMHSTAAAAGTAAAAFAAAAAATANSHQARAG